MPTDAINSTPYSLPYPQPDTDVISSIEQLTKMDVITTTTYELSWNATLEIREKGHARLIFFLL